MNNLMDYLWGFLVFCAGFLTVVLVFSLLSYARSPTFALRKIDWTCVKSHYENSTIYITQNNVMVPISSSSEVCDAYQRKVGAQP